MQCIELTMILSDKYIVSPITTHFVNVVMPFLRNRPSETKTKFSN